MRLKNLIISFVILQEDTANEDEYKQIIQKV